ncbi:MAG TPA: helix-turn-helix domain-containing protein [Acidobacteriota bacterium]|nr:helix-turn-helix domain-containing protein [Acidobacteriota bacterium]
MSDHPVNDYVCESIRLVRLEKGIKVQDMARRTGIPLGSYSCLETGRYRMSLDLLFRILCVLGLNIEQTWPYRVEEASPEMTAEQVRRIVRRAARDRPALVTNEEILSLVCTCLGITRKDLLSDSRQRHLAEGRALAALLCKETPHLSLLEMSRLLGRHPSSLSHSLRRLSRRLQWDQRMKLHLKNCRAELAALTEKKRKGNGRDRGEER